MPSKLSQYRGLTYAIRWQSGMLLSDFLDNQVDGDRWLSWAAGTVSSATQFIFVRCYDVRTLFEGR